MSKKLIGLKLADGTFYPVLNEGIPVKKHLKVTASSDNQTSMKIELFRASDESFADAEYIQTMVLDQMLPQKKENHLIKNLRTIKRLRLAYPTGLLFYFYARSPSLHAV